MDSVRRAATWILAGLAVGVAARALTRSQPQAELVGALPAADAVAPGADAPLAAAQPAAKHPVRDDEPTARFQTTLAMSRVLIQRLRAHTTTVVAGSLAYYGLLAVVPAAIAAISIYGIVANPSDLANLLESLASRLPSTTSELINVELGKIVSKSGAGLGIATAIGIVTALWSASAGAKVLITGVNLAYGERETRSYLVVRGLALALTIGMVVGIVVVVAGVAVLPALIHSPLTSLARWPALMGLVVVGLAVLYRIAPSDAPGRHHPVWTGAFAAAAMWLAATAGFSTAVTASGRFSATYGVFAGVVMLLVWFFVSGLIVLLGAELNAAIEIRRDRLSKVSG